MHTIDDVCQILRASRSAVLSWITSGELSATDVAPANGKRRLYRVSPESLERFRLARQSGPPAPRPTMSKVRSFV